MNRIEIGFDEEKEKKHGGERRWICYGFSQIISSPRTLQLLAQKKGGVKIKDMKVPGDFPLKLVAFAPELTGISLVRLEFVIRVTIASRF